MELGRELDRALGRDGIKGIERISEGYGRECTIYRAQKGDNEATPPIQRMTRGDTIGKRNRPNSQ